MCTSPILAAGLVGACITWGNGLWIVDCGLRVWRIMDYGLWIMDYGSDQKD